MKNLIYVFLAIAILSCGDKEDDCTPTPEFSEIELSNATDTSVSVSASITPPTCDESITSQGFVYSKDAFPEIDEDFVKEVSGNNISAIIKDLEQNQTYYIRAYLENPLGIFYGEEVEFKTMIGEIGITTIEPFDIDFTFAKTGGQILLDGGSEVIKRGIVYNDSGNPDISNNVIESGNGNGTYEVLIENLEKGKDYYVKAFLQNNDDEVHYGEEFMFTTYDEPIVITNDAKNIEKDKALLGGNVSKDGGLSIVEKGICWTYKNNVYPTIEDNSVTKKEMGNGLGSFETIFENLNMNSNINYWTYAIDERGDVWYGELKNFKTLYGEITLVIDNLDTKIINSNLSIRMDDGNRWSDYYLIYSKNNSELNLNTNDPRISLHSSNEWDSNSNYYETNYNLENLEQGTEYYLRLALKSISDSMYHYSEVYTIKTAEGIYVPDDNLEMILREKGVDDGINNDYIYKDLAVKITELGEEYIFEHIEINDITGINELVSLERLAISNYSLKNGLEIDLPNLKFLNVSHASTEYENEINIIDKNSTIEEFHLDYTRIGWRSKPSDIRVLNLSEMKNLKKVFFDGYNFNVLNLKNRNNEKIERVGFGVSDEQDLCILVDDLYWAERVIPNKNYGINGCD